VAETAEALAPFLASPEPETRRRAAFGLAVLETPDAEVRLRVLLGDADPAVRVTALRLYMRPWLRARVEADEGLGRRMVGLLREDEADVVRGAAAGLLGLVQRVYAEEELARALAGADRDPEPYPRSAAAAALARRDGPLARAALVDALADEHEGVRRGAIEALFRITGTYRGFDPDGSPEARAAAVQRWRAWLQGLDD
jgi:HEAT repeat protein